MIKGRNDQKNKDTGRKKKKSDKNKKRKTQENFFLTQERKKKRLKERHIAIEKEKDIIISIRKIKGHTEERKA